MFKFIYYYILYFKFILNLIYFKKKERIILRINNLYLQNFSLSLILKIIFI